MGFNKAILVFLGVLLLGSGLAMAIRGAAVTNVTDLTRWTAVGSPGYDTTEGGNISINNLNVSSLTDRWAGFMGNVTGELYLTDNASGTANYLFKWTSASISSSGDVCLSTGSAFNFAAATTATAAAIDTAWGFGQVADNATRTFTATTCDLYFSEQGVTITDTATADHGAPSTFMSCAIDDGGAGETNFAFCTNETQTAGTAYNAYTVNYEVMVPTSFGSGVYETYYFYAELN